VDCHICQEEALIALKMKRDGKSLAEIQQAVDKAFEKQYPFDEVSAKFQKYKDSRLYKAAAGASSAKSKSGMSSLTKEDLKTGLPSDTSTKSANSKSQTRTAKPSRQELAQLARLAAVAAVASQKNSSKIQSDSLGCKESAPPPAIATGYQAGTDFHLK
jgi:hypothetical protein